MYVLYTYAREVMAIGESSGLLKIPSEISVKVTMSEYFFPKNHFPPLSLFVVFLASSSCQKLA
jgi:hypothetical protein